MAEPPSREELVRRVVELSKGVPVKLTAARTKTAAETAAEDAATSALASLLLVGQLGLRAEVVEDRLELSPADRVPGWLRTVIEELDCEAGMVGMVRKVEGVIAGYEAHPDFTSPPPQWRKPKLKVVPPVPPGAPSGAGS